MIDLKKIIRDTQAWQCLHLEVDEKILCDVNKHIASAIRQALIAELTEIKQQYCSDMCDCEPVEILIELIGGKDCSNKN